MKICYKECLTMALVAVSQMAFCACEDELTTLPLAYEEDPNFAPPHLDQAWSLEEAPDQEPTVGIFVYKDRIYNQLFTRTLGWNGGDGVLTVELPGGNLLWTFNDSFYGVVDGETRARGNCSFPRNTIMVQSADANGMPSDADASLHWLVSYNQTADPQAAGYYKAYTHIDHPKATSFNGDGIAQDFLYWSGDGIVVNNQLQMLWMGVHTPGDGSMISQNTCLAVYSLDGAPGDESYMKMLSANHDFLPENPYGYGSTLYDGDDGHVYLYSSVGNGQFLGNVPIVARTATRDLTSPWEYYVVNDDGEMVWQADYPSLLQVQNSGIAPGQGSLTLPWVFKQGDYYYMTAQTFPYGREFIIMRARNPWGPFEDKAVLMTFPNPLDELQGDPYGNQYNHLYMLNIHPGLSRDGELVVSTNTDAGDTVAGADDAFWRNFSNPGSADWYRPFFYRIFKWERAFR